MRQSIKTSIEGGWCCSRNLAETKRFTPCAIAAVVLVALICGGCQTVRVPVTGSVPSAPNKPQVGTADGSLDDILGEDPCAARLHDLSGQLLLYYADYGRFPDTLDALRAFSRAQPVDYTCPVSHRPYVYFPRGLVAQGESQRLLVADPTPAHKGNRWVIVFTGAPGRHGLDTSVIELSEGIFETYSASPLVPAPAATQPGAAASVGK